MVQESESNAGGRYIVIKPCRVDIWKAKGCKLGVSEGDSDEEMRLRLARMRVMSVRVGE